MQSEAVQRKTKSRINLEKCAVILTPRLTTLTHPNHKPFDLEVSSSLGPAMGYICADYGVDSSSRLPPEHAETDRHTDTRTNWRGNNY